MRCRQCQAPTASRDTCSVCKQDPSVLRPRAVDRSVLESALVSTLRALDNAEAPPSLHQGLLPRYLSLRTLLQLGGALERPDALPSAATVARLPLGGALHLLYLATRTGSADSVSTWLGPIVERFEKETLPVPVPSPVPSQKLTPAPSPAPAPATAPGLAPCLDSEDVTTREMPALVAPLERPEEQETGEPEGTSLQIPGEVGAASEVPTSAGTVAASLGAVGAELHYLCSGVDGLMFRLRTWQAGASTPPDVSTALPSPLSDKFLEYALESLQARNSDQATSWRTLAHWNGQGWKLGADLAIPPPSDLEVWQQELRCEAIALFLLWLGFAPPSEPRALPKTLPGVGKEVWHGLQEQMASVRDPLTPPPFLVRFKTALFKRDRAYFRRLDTQQWIDSLRTDALAPLLEGATSLGDNIWAALERELAADLQSSLLRGGLKGLAEAGEALRTSTSQVIEDLASLLASQQRSEDKGRVMLRQRLDNLVVQADSLMWLVRRPTGWEDAVDAANHAVDLMRDTCMLSCVLEAMRKVTHAVLAAHDQGLQTALAQEARLSAMRASCEHNLHFVDLFETGFANDIAHATRFVQESLSPEQLEGFTLWAALLGSDPEASLEADNKLLRSATAVVRNALARRPSAMPPPLGEGLSGEEADASQETREMPAVEETGTPAPPPPPPSSLPA